MESDRNYKIYADIVHLARLALSGSKEELGLVIKRLARSLADSSPEASEKLLALLKGQQTRAFRNENMHSIPVDRDSRLSLLKIEYPIELSGELVLIDEVKKQMDALIKERQQYHALAVAGFSPSKSALFSGRPGVGKTLMARTIAKTLDVPLLVLDLSAVMSSFLGRTGSNLKSIFEYAKGMRCVLLLDEIDAIAKKRNDNAELGELKRLVNVLIQEIDSWPSTNLLIGATNHPELLDPAIWRRFDVVIKFPDPDKTQITKIILNSLGPNKLSVKLIDVLSTILGELSLSEIENEINKVLKHCFLNNLPIGEGVLELISTNISNMSHEQRIDLARDLFKSGVCSQRKASELTGVSRDTIRIGLDMEKSQ